MRIRLSASDPFRPRRDAAGWHRCGLALGMLLAVAAANPAVAKDTDDDDGEPAKPERTIPNVYLDLNTVYTTLPAGVLGIGFKNFTSLPTLSSPSSQTLTLNAPLTVDLSDRISVYAGISGSTSRTDAAAWSDIVVDSWNVGLQADVVEQNGGMFPTVTLQSTLTRTMSSNPVGATTFTNIVDLDYALNSDETIGLLTGGRYVKVVLDSDLASIAPSIIGYAGGYYQWPNNWKLSGRFGVQSFGGAVVAGQQPFKPFTQPIVRFDLERMDDDDNRLFGVTAEISWTPKPAYQLTLRTPLYAIKN